MICFILLVIAILYWLILAPTISRFFIPHDCIFHNITYYTDNTFLEFENGKSFREVLLHFDCIDKGEVIDFYYVDNYTEDNPIYGKMCDIYALDVKFARDIYLVEHSKIQKAAETYQSRGDFVSYALPHISDDNNFIIVVSFCDKVNTVRYIMITEAKEVLGFDQIIARHSNLDWEAGQ